MHRCEGFGVSVDSKLHLNERHDCCQENSEGLLEKGQQHLGSAREALLGGAPTRGYNIQREAIRIVMTLSVRKEGSKDRLHHGGKPPEESAECMFWEGCEMMGETALSLEKRAAYN